MMAVVGTGVGRVVIEPMQLGKHAIPKGTILWAPIQAIQSSPTLWDQPDSFMPVCDLPNTHLEHADMSTEAGPGADWSTYQALLLIQQLDGSSHGQLVGCNLP